MNNIMILDPDTTLAEAIIRRMNAIGYVHPDVTELAGRIRHFQPDVVLLHPSFAGPLATTVIRQAGPPHVQVIALLDGSGPPPPQISGYVDGHISRLAGVDHLAWYITRALRRRTSLLRMRAARASDPELRTREETGPATRRDGR